MVYESNWATCPLDVLILVIRQLDLRSIINCMDINTFWRNAVYYYCEHLNLWRILVKDSIENEGLILAEKSVLGWRDQFLSARGWLNIKNSLICMHHQYEFNYVGNICVHRDKLIITTNTAVLYYDIDSFELIKSIETSCFSYQETSSLIVQVLTPPIVGEYKVLALTNKSHSEFVNAFASTLLHNNIILRVCLFKVHFNSCYVTDDTNVLWSYTANGNNFDKRIQAKYYGHRDSMCSIHIHKTNVYILLKRGDVLLVNQERKQFEKVYDFCGYLHGCLYLSEKCFIFHIFSIILEAPKDENVKIFRHTETQTIAMICPGITCVTEHGHVLLLGYEDGKIEIYLIRKILEQSTPELQFNLQNYLTEALPSPKITGIDLFEDTKLHHLFVSTMYNVYELLLQY